METNSTVKQTHKPFNIMSSAEMMNILNYFKSQGIDVTHIFNNKIKCYSIIKNLFEVFSEINNPSNKSMKYPWDIKYESSHPTFRYHRNYLAFLCEPDSPCASYGGPSLCEECGCSWSLFSCGDVKRKNGEVPACPIREAKIMMNDDGSEMSEIGCDWYDGSFNERIDQDLRSKYLSFDSEYSKLYIKTWKKNLPQYDDGLIYRLAPWNNIPLGSNVILYHYFKYIFYLYSKILNSANSINKM